MHASARQAWPQHDRPTPHSLDSALSCWGDSFPSLMQPACLRVPAGPRQAAPEAKEVPRLALGANVRGQRGAAIPLTCTATLVPRPKLVPSALSTVGRCNSNSTNLGGLAGRAPAVRPGVGARPPSEFLPPLARQPSDSAGPRSATPRAPAR